MERIRNIPELERQADHADSTADFARNVSLLLFGTGTVLTGLNVLNSGDFVFDLNVTGFAGGLSAGTIFAYYRIKERRLRRQIARLENLQEHGTIIEGVATEITDHPRLGE